jgi:hypothetical protein
VDAGSGQGELPGIGETRFGASTTGQITGESIIKLIPETIASRLWLANYGCRSSEKLQKFSAKTVLDAGGKPLRILESRGREEVERCQQKLGRFVLRNKSTDLLTFEPKRPHNETRKVGEATVWRRGSRRSPLPWILLIEIYLLGRPCNVFSRL